MWLDKLKWSKWSQRFSLKKGKVKLDKFYREFSEVFYLNSCFYPVFEILIKEKKMRVLFIIV